MTYDTKDTKDVYVDLEGTQEFDDVFGADGRVAADNVKLIDYANDGDYETILVNTVTVAKANSVTDSALTVGSTGSRDTSIFGNTRTIDLDDNTVADDIAKGDYVAITKNDYDGSWIVEKVASVEGTVNGLVKNERRIRVDGEWYTLANSKEGTPYETYVVSGGRTEFTNGDEITMYVIGSVVYFADSARGNDANRSVLMVYETQSQPGIWNKQDKVKAIFANGDKETITIDFNDAVKNLDDIDIGRMYYYEVNNDDEYALYEVDEDTLVGYDEYNETNGLVRNGRIGNKTIADDAVVFALIGGNDAAVYTGKTVKDADENLWNEIENGGALIEETNNINYARMLNVSIDSELDDATNYAYLLTNAVRSVDDKQYIEYTMWTQDDEIVEALEETNAHARPRWKRAT